ncbi:MAG: hypothetical protein EU539_01440 [Promethearchaeota archaeon]|nr:MAG: hypothetical protein EU539_01440 [Candidatus Lokiarchaeota archaeon]
MTDTARTTVTLTENYMNRIKKLVGKFATTKAQVISKIVENFLDSSEYFNYLEQLEREQTNYEINEAKELAKKPEIYHKKINNVLSGGNMIPIDEFLNYLNIDFDFFFDKLPEWKEKYGIFYENGKIIKNHP